MKYKKIEGHNGLVKTEDGVILNTNKSEIEAARERKRLRKEKEKEVEELKNDVSELKDMMKQILEKL
jgi:hypothetical protein